MHTGLGPVCLSAEDHSKAQSQISPQMGVSTPRNRVTPAICTSSGYKITSPHRSDLWINCGGAGYPFERWIQKLISEGLRGTHSFVRMVNKEGKWGETTGKGEALSILCVCSTWKYSPDSDEHPRARLTDHDRRVALCWVKGTSSFAIFIFRQKLKGC